jgi:dipeptidase
MFWINQATQNKPAATGGISWIGLDRPAANCLMPFFAGVKNLPVSMQTMKLTSFDKNSAWWAFNFVANYANLKYAYMIEDITDLQQKLESEAYEEVKKVQEKDITAYCEKNTGKVLQAWWNLSETLIVKYNNGCITTEDAIMQKIDYPDWWLQKVEYYDGPTSYAKKS